MSWLESQLDVFDFNNISRQFFECTSRACCCPSTDIMCGPTSHDTREPSRNKLLCNQEFSFGCFSRVIQRVLLQRHCMLSCKLASHASQSPPKRLLSTFTIWEPLIDDEFCHMIMLLRYLAKSLSLAKIWMRCHSGVIAQDKVGENTTQWVEKTCDEHLVHLCSFMLIPWNDWSPAKPRNCAFRAGVNWLAFPQQVMQVSNLVRRAKSRKRLTSFQNISQQISRSFVTLAYWFSCPTGWNWVIIRYGFRRMNKLSHVIHQHVRGFRSRSKERGRERYPQVQFLFSLKVTELR